MLKKIDQVDFQFISEALMPFKNDLKQKKIFITGATGFIGKWIVFSLLYINKTSKLDLEITVLSRSKAKAEKIFPEVRVIEGDIKDIKIENEFDYIIHAANESNPNSNELYDTITKGTANIIKIANESGVRRFLNVSTGGVYKKQTAEILFLNEESPLVDSGFKENPYGVGKCNSEKIINNSQNKPELVCTHARCFAFAGAYLPLRERFAIGNFLDDKLNDREVHLKGDGTPLRSYMYAADLVVWLVTILLKGKNGEAYNVGSDEAISIKDVAMSVNSTFLGNTFDLQNKYTSENKYIPSIEKAKTELGLRLNYNYHDTVTNFVNWHLN